MILDFQWECAGPGGYVWSEGSHPAETKDGRRSHFHFFKKTDRTLYRVIEAPKRIYHPLRDCPAMFRDLAQTPPTEVGILRFVERYGMLGGPFHDNEFPLGNSKDELHARALDAKFVDVFGESFDNWRSFIETFTKLVTLGDTLKRSSHATANKRGLCGAINGHLAHVAAHLEVRPDGGFRLSYAPANLFEAIWFQFAAALGNGSRFVDCASPICRKAVEISQNTTTGKRADAQYCSDACKQREHRKRTHARALYSAGRTIRAIAAEIDRHPPLVKSWVSASR
jgi:hypothetical protein